MEICIKGGKPGHVSSGNEVKMPIKILQKIKDKYNV